MKQHKSKIVCFGEVLWDMLPTGEKPGGAPMNVALHLKNFGFDVEMISKVGQDEPGRALIEFMKGSGLNTNLIQKDGNLPTSKVLVHINGQHVRYEICEPVAWDNIELTDELKEKAKSTDIIVYGTLAARNAETRNTLFSLLNLNEDTVKIIDVNLRPPYDSISNISPLLQKANVIKLNDEEIDKIAEWYKFKGISIEEKMRWVAEEFSAHTVCLTMGEKGAYLFHNEQLFHHKGYRVDAKDPVGAGDAFLAGYIYALISGKNPQNSLDYACATGALVASKTGATPAYNFEEIEHIKKC